MNIMETKVEFGNKFYCENGERHNFAGGKCIKCRASQNPIKKVEWLISNQSPVEIKKNEPIKGIYTQEQDLVRTLANYFNEPKKFGMYMGIVKKQGMEKCYKIYSELKEQSIKSGKLFMWLIKK